MKVLGSPADLAINGAQPLFPAPLHVGRPNIGDRARFQQLLDQMFERNWFSNDGPIVREFERKVESYLGVKHCVAMCNGTIALEIAIRALGLKGEVIVPSFTFVATAHALYWQGITPVFADIDPKTHHLDPLAVRRMLTPRTSGIIGVHLWGRPAPVDSLQELADEFGLQLLFDSAHAFGCTHNAQMIGRFGRAEVLSFHATKFFNTFEGGAVVTNDDSLAEAMRLMRNFGFVGYDNVIHPGTNGKMTEVCAAMGLAGFECIDGTIERNCHNLSVYRDGLAGVRGLTLLDYPPKERSNFQYVVVEVNDESATQRDTIVRALHAENVLARKYFWPGCHGMSPYREHFPHAGLMLPHTNEVARRVIVLPTGTSVADSEIGGICELLRLLVERGVE